jgi:hypothetical protein
MHLSRVVKSIVLASLIVCVAGAARASIQAGREGSLDVTHARITMRDRPLSASFVTIHDDPDPSGAHPAPTKASRHAPGRAIGARHTR